MYYMERSRSMLLGMYQTQFMKGIICGVERKSGIIQDFFSQKENHFYTYFLLYMYIYMPEMG